MFELSKSSRASAPLNDSIATALGSLVDDAQDKRREPSHSDLTVVIRSHGLEAADPQFQPNPVGKKKRVTSVLSWAIDNDSDAGERLVAGIVSQVRGFGGFRKESANYCGDDAVQNLASAFSTEGYVLTSDGTLHPAVLDGLVGTPLTEALKAYVRRAKTGSRDAALVTGTGKDLLEAVAGHILTDRLKGYPQSSNFPALLAAVFVQLGLTVPSPDDEPPKNEPAQRQVERAMFNLAISINRLRNKEGTGHGRPWESSVTDSEARYAIESMGAVAEFLLTRHEQYH
jgi:hypothetical protein